MISRKPDLRVEDTPIIWTKVREFSHICNGTSVMIPYVEHYLNNIVNEIRTRYGDADPVLKQELDLFIRQEATHAKYHHQFNKRIFDQGHPRMKALVANLNTELKGFRENWSLAMNIAYCAGFENIALFSCKYTYDKCADLFEGAHPGGANLYLWHQAEEFEHRSVCHDAFKAVSGNYFIRAAGLLYAFWHISKCFDSAAAVLLEADRASMTPAERKASIRREKAIKRRQFLYTLPKLLILLRPGYTPGRYATPPKIQAALDYFNGKQPILESFDLAAAH